MSTPDRINSTGQVVLESETLENNSRSGNGYTRVFTGSLNIIKAQRLIELAGGATMVKAESQGDGSYRLTSYYPWDVTNGSNAEAPVNAHELEIGSLTVDVFASSVMLAQLVAAFGSYTAALGAKSFLKGAVASYESTAMDAPAITAAEQRFTSTYSGSELALMLNLFRGIAYNHIKDATEFTWTYSRRITAATYNQVIASGVGVGQIWTAAEVTAFENIPTAGFFQLSSNYLWYKYGPRVKMAANQKTEVEYQYKSTTLAWTGTSTAYGTATLLSF